MRITQSVLPERLQPDRSIDGVAERARADLISDWRLIHLHRLIFRLAAAALRANQSRWLPLCAQTNRDGCRFARKPIAMAAGSRANQSRWVARPTPCYLLSSRRFASFTSFFHFAISDLICALNCSGELPTGIEPSAARRVATSGCLSASTMAAFSFLTIG